MFPFHMIMCTSPDSPDSVAPIQTDDGFNTLHKLNKNAFTAFSIATNFAGSSPPQRSQNILFALVK